MSDESYEQASADVVLPLSLADAESIAEALEFLAGVDEGEHTDHDDLLRLAALVRSRIPALSLVVIWNHETGSHRTVSTLSEVEEVVKVPAKWGNEIGEYLVHERERA
jgi:hypothetical protein